MNDSNPLLRFVVVLVMGVCLLFLLQVTLNNKPISSSWEDMEHGLVVVLLLSWLLSTPRATPFWRQLKQVGIWLLVIALLVGGYSFRHELGGVSKRIMAALMPQSGFEEIPGTMSFYRAAGGHFHIEALVNGQKVRFLADTGASDIVLAPHLAGRLGFNPDQLRFTKKYHTANGTGRGAPVRLESFEVGGLRMEGLPASFNGAPMRESLLGMRFFNRLYGYQVQGDILAVSWVDKGTASR